MERARSDTESLLSSPTPTYYAAPGGSHSCGKKSDQASTCTLSASGGATYTLTGGGLLGSICALLLLVIITLQVLNTLQVPTRDPDLAEHERIHREWDKEIRGHEETRVKWKEEKMLWEGEHEETRVKWEEEKRLWEGEREKTRIKWKKEKMFWEREHEKTRVAWKEEKMFWEGEHRKWSVWKQQWEVDHQRHEKDRKLWEEERAHWLGLLWDTPRDEEHCAAYNTRGYTARMNPMLACKSAPIVIHNETMTPSWCEATSNEIVGHFTVNSDQPACRPYWDKWYDKGCIEGGMRRVESRLWDLKDGDDWQRMYDTTPARVNGIAFSHPTRCESRGWIYGMVGMFEYPDTSCGWNPMGNISDVEQPPVNTL
ncbi:hypothetical protein PHLCEN_2v10673 [Hermanssonia centrifuga]|uniref:Uncharacterized protein n=1 Tax=Hermanssonia centrifuga TaxID=98765 RepID=A0A2R6NLY5_9APHY|nr:hypothetical protein PHLCEN_2v10673 [Hermanssonia centrifuga]